MPRTLIAGNWKMNTTPAEAVALAGAIRSSVGEANTGDIDVAVFPPSVSLAGVSDALEGSPVRVGAQNIHHEDSGAYTGEVSPAMLSGICDYVLAGHSERRQLFGEDDEAVNLKVLAALRHGLRPVLCVGETLAQREAGDAARVVASQVRGGLSGVVDITAVVVAYEPVWAIGTGQAATPETASEIMEGAIQTTLMEMFGLDAEAIPLLYGGSVNPANAAGFLSQAVIHGALVGGASLDADQFAGIVKAAIAAKGTT